MSTNEMKFIIADDNGKETKCDILFTFTDKGRDFIVYTDNVVIDGFTRVLASFYTITKNQELALSPITSDEDWQLVEKTLEEVQAEVQNGGFMEE